MLTTSHDTFFRFLQQLPLQHASRVSGTPHTLNTLTCTPLVSCLVTSGFRLTAVTTRNSYRVDVLFCCPGCLRHAVSASVKARRFVALFEAYRVRLARLEHRLTHSISQVVVAVVVHVLRNSLGAYVSTDRLARGKHGRCAHDPAHAHASETRVEGAWQPHALPSSSQ